MMLKLPQIALLFLLFTSGLSGQVVFSPPGAEWRCSWTSGMMSQNKTNEYVRYVRDSVIGANTYKVLRHSAFFMDDCGGNPGISLLDQRGDTVLFRNALTGYEWEVLYNFAAAPTQSWTTAVNDGSSIRTHSCTVLSVSTVTVNNLPLRQLAVQLSFPTTSGPYTYTLTITERLGSSVFLFYFHSFMFGGCDVGNFAGNLCYTDNVFGAYQYSNKPCDYVFVGLKEEEPATRRLRAYPNPAASHLELDVDGSAGQVRLTAADGRQLPVDLQQVSAGKLKLDLGALPNGLYLLQVLNIEGVMGTARVVVEH